MKILLTAINAKYVHSNLAVYSLKAYADKACECLKKSEVPQIEAPKIEIAEYTINQELDHIIRDIYKRKPDILCLSCYIWNIAYAGAVVREMRKLNPHMHIWLGGPEVSYDSADVLERMKEVDGVMKGEGEETFAALSKVYALHGTEGAVNKFLSIEGISYRDTGNRIVENQWRPVIDLGKVPFIYKDMELFRNKILYYESSRGCPFSCSYCLSSVDKKLRFRDLSMVKEELQFFIDHEVAQVKFVDRTFNCNHHHAAEIWRYIKEHDNGVTNFHFEVAADLLNDEELDIIEDMRPGLIQLEIGVQSTNPDTIREIKRTMDFDRVRNVTERIHQKGNIHQHLDLIAGLPFEDIQSFQKSFDAVYNLHPDQLQLGFLKVLKGSYMEQCREKYGLVYQDRPPYEVLFTKWLTYDDILRLKNIEEMVEVYYNSGQFANTMDKLAGEFDSPYDMYDRLGIYYQEKNPGNVQYKRSDRYSILLDFIKNVVPDREDYYRELLTYDYYLRENAKSRPSFAGDYKVDKEYLRKFYDREQEERRYLKGYEQYDKNQMRRMTHLERFPLLGKMILFDYMHRNPLNQEAVTCMIEDTTDSR